MGILRLALAAALVAGPACAHVTVQPAAAPAGSYQVLRFGSGHGCDGQATTALRIEIPASVGTARPQPKPGWRMAIEHAPGKPDTVAAIVWRGRIPADQFDEFLIQVKFGDAAGPVAFPAIQTCGKAEARWTDPGGDHPAPRVTLSPAAPRPADTPEHKH